MGNPRHIGNFLNVPKNRVKSLVKDSKMSSKFEKKKNEMSAKNLFFRDVSEHDKVPTIPTIKNYLISDSFSCNTFTETSN